MLVLFGSGQLPAEAAFTSRKAEGEQKLNSIRESTKQKSSEAQQVKEQIDRKMDEISKIEGQIADWDKKIGELNEQLQKNQVLLDKKEKKLKSVIARMYIQGENNYLAQLLEADSLSLFLRRYEILHWLVKQHMDDFRSYKETKKVFEAERKQLIDAKGSQEALLAKSKKSVAEFEQVYQQHQAELKELEKQENAVLKEYVGVFTSGSGMLLFPTTPGPIFWNFMENRGNHKHKGVDIPRPAGTDIYAADDGVVTAINSNPGGYGVYIVIDHGNGFQTLYAHMFRSTVTVSVGEHVKRGQKIAEVGNNGHSVGEHGGYHLHFEVHKNGNPVNPKNYL
jgi:murein DD-endopeptidase MepM/ murein hydrolase activator NlpD